MAFTEFYCQTTGSNLNAGSTTADAAVYTGVGDSDGTSIFTPSDGSTPANTVAVGDFGSVYVTAGATIATFIGRITAVAAGVNGNVTFSTTAKSGTFPAASAGAHTITLKTGGAWKGPNAAVSFPFGFITAAQMDSSSNIPRVNFKSGTNYSITAAMTHSVAGPVIFQGYTTTAGDLGRATIDGGTSGASYILMSSTVAAANVEFRDLIFQNNGATGTQNGVVTAAPTYIRCVVNNVRAVGYSSNSAFVLFVECEAYACNQSNTNGVGGFQFQSSAMAVRCISHDNTGSNSAGFLTNSNAAGQIFLNCIADTNGGDGFRFTGNGGQFQLSGCDSYNNTSDGLEATGSSSALILIITNCNFIKNGGWGINGSNSGMSKKGYLWNNGYGAGTQANSSGTTTGTLNIEETGAVTYASGVTPWVDPANGDFRIILPTAKGTGRGAFTQTAASYAGTIAYPDIGAAQHKEMARKIPSI